MKFILASGNAHKKEEIAAAFPTAEVVSLKDIGFEAEIEEYGKTLEENALIKARTIFDIYGLAVIADDTGLCVDALGGEPGTYSARYASRAGRGDADADAANRAYLLERLAGVPEMKRSAYFKTVIAYIDRDGVEHLVSGRCEGRILTHPVGDAGFGYDALFFSNDLQKTFASADISEKNSVSHRGRAIAALKKITELENPYK